VAQSGTDLKPEPTSKDHVRGSLDAEVVIAEYGDFECPYCGQAFAVLEELRKKFGSRVALVFRHYPLEMHPHARAAAEAAEAAASVGKFWEMHDALYEHQNALTNHDLVGYAGKIGVDGAVVEKAVEHNTYAKRIERDEASGDDSGIEGTPALFINGYAYDDEVSVETLGATIERALASVKA
jgi:protein-disulfide isomerase